MGLLDSIVATATGVVAAVPLVGAPAAGIIGQVTAPVLQIAGEVPVVGSLVAGGDGDGGFLGLGGLLGGGAQEVPMGRPALPGALAGERGQFGGGNGRFANITVVRTLDRVTGEIFTRSVKQGMPHIMNSDVAVCRRVIRQSTKLAKRIPRKTVKESKTKQLTDAAVDAAMRNVQCCDQNKSC